MSTPDTAPEFESALSAEKPVGQNISKDEKLALQIHELIMAGGTVGDTLNYTTQDYEALYTVGHSYYQQARYEDAFKVFAFLMVHNHLEVRFIMAYAASLQMLQKWNEAIHNYSLASALDMMNPQPVLHVCECLIGLEQYAQAREGLELVLARAQQLDMADMVQKVQVLMDFVSDRQDTPVPAV